VHAEHGGEGPTSQQVGLGRRPPETELPTAPAALARALAQALAQPVRRRRQAVAEVVASDPAFLDGWAALGTLARDPLEAYACFRVGYHRGLDALRAAGWRGSGLVRWSRPANRGFLRCLHGLARAAEQLGAIDEAVTAYRAVALLDESDPAEVHYRLARLLSQKGNRDEARREVLKSLEEAPRFLDAHRLLLELVERSENHAKAAGDGHGHPH